MKRLVPLAGLAALALSACNKATAPAVSPAANGSTASSSPVVASYAGKEITLDVLDKSIARELFETRTKALQTMILRDLVQEEARKAGKEEEAFLKEIAEKQAAPPSETEAKEIYERFKDRFPGRSFEEMKETLIQQIGQQKQGEGMMAYFEELKQKAGVRILLAEPKVEVEAVGPTRGPAEAPVTIVLFSDFQCPFCGKVRPSMDKVLASYAGKVRLVWRDFPLSFHPQAPKAAEAGLCAHEQGKFWEMHDHLFDHQDKLAPEELKAAARTIGLDGAKFDACLDSGKQAAVVQKSLEAGKAAGVSGTPAFFVNGRMLSGAQPFEKFKEAIDKELSAN
jgi:protein-disulfide isomerase